MTSIAASPELGLNAKIGSKRSCGLMLSNGCSFPQSKRSKQEKSPRRELQFNDAGADLGKLRRELEHKRQVEVNALMTELEFTRNKLAGMVGEVDKLNAENKILRKAVTIQNGQKEGALREIAHWKNSTEQANLHIKKVEQSNYALRVHLQALETSNAPHFRSHQPDVY